MPKLGKPVLSLLLFILLISFFSSQTSAKEFDSLEQTINFALQNSPNIAALQARYMAMSKIPSQKAALPEPRLAINAVNLPIDSFALNQTPMSQIQLGISQMLPFPGKLSLSQQSAKQEANAAESNIQNARRQLKLHISRLWWQMFYLEKALVTINHNSELLKQFVDIAQTKYQIGQGQQQDVLLAQVEANRLLDTESKLLSQRNAVQAKINSLTGRKQNQTIRISPIISEQLPKIDQTKLDYLLAEKQRPDFIQKRAKIQAAKIRVDLAKKTYYPDFKLGAVYGWREAETDFASVLFSMNLPINTTNRQDSLRDQRNQELLQQKYRMQDMRNNLAAEINTALFNYQQAKKQSTIYKNNILPQSQQTVDAMLAGYQVNKVDFLNLIRSQMTFFNYETQYWQALSIAKQALAELNAAMGQELEYE